MDAAKVGLSFLDHIVTYDRRNAKAVREGNATS
jgi:hypothetical protein